MFSPLLRLPSVATTKPSATAPNVLPRALTEPPQGTNVLTPADMKCIMDGAAFLSVGGGGPKQLGNKLLETLGQNNVAMLSLDEVADQQYVAISAYLGSPAAAFRLQNPTFNSLRRAIQTLERASGNKISCVVPGEMGAVNSIAPLLAAHDLGLAVVDADGCGRAVPILAATTFGQVDALTSTYGAALTNDADDAGAYQSAVVAATNVTEVQSALGALISSPAYGNLGATALWMMTGAQLKSVAVAGSLSRALAIGRALQNSSGDYLNTLLQALRLVGLPARSLFGTVPLVPKTFDLTTVGTHDQGTLVLQRQDTGELLTVFTINENIYAFSNQNAEPLLLSPDMLGWLGVDGSTFDNSTLSAAITEGQAKPLYAVGVAAVQMIGAPSQPGRICFRDDPAIQAVMLQLTRAIGYAGPYVPFQAR